jgi:hypothetical protein
MSDRGELTNKHETVLADIPRGREGHELLRVRHCEATTPEGRDVEWTDLREHYKADDGTWRPGKKGISIRTRELAQVIEALRKVSAGQVGPATAPVPTGGARRAAQHREVSATRPELPGVDGPTDEECGF